LSFTRPSRRRLPNAGAKRYNQRFNLVCTPVALSAGARLGPYEIAGFIGAGGMGEVYRARDPRLGREVAVKVLPAAFNVDGDRQRRFEREARAAAALNHPNILAVYDIGTDAGTTYVVSELLHGETLRSRLSAGALSLRKALEYAIQIARGLVAAHETGIVHRDLKPENLFVTSDGHVKILDFGLAKPSAAKMAADKGLDIPTVTFDTDTGVVLGTVGYMSPEQVKGQPTDHRSDIFALGAICYEMLAGARAFDRATAVETMTAILREDPPDLSVVCGDVPPALGHIVRHCLEKRPGERFQSTRDLAFALEAAAQASGPNPAPVVTGIVPPRLRRSWFISAALVGATLIGIWIGTVAGRQSRAAAERTTSGPSFQRLTFRFGYVRQARFAPDGRTIIYSAAWEGEQPQIFATRVEGPESRPLGLGDADVLAVSASSELAVLLRPSWPRFLATGTLARMPVTGGAPRELLERVIGADWDAAGARLAIVRDVGGRSRLEFPIGKILYESADRIDVPRVSPSGDAVAFAEQGAVAIVNLAGEKKTLTTGWTNRPKVAWSPGGQEVWFTAARTGQAAEALRAVTRSGALRFINESAGGFTLYDIASDGRVLMNRTNSRKGLLGRAAGQATERDLSWLDWAHVADISADGSVLLFTEAGSGGGPGQAVYVRKTDGSPAVRLGEGTAQALSPDGKWALAIRQAAEPTTNAIPPGAQLVLLPTGAGEVRTLTDGSIACRAAKWFPDGKRVVIVAQEKGHGIRTYVQRVETDRPKAITPEGTAGALISPDGLQLIVSNGRGLFSLFPLEGSGEAHPIAGLAPGDQPIQWSADARSIYVRRNVEGTATVRVFRLDLSTGAATPWRDFVQDPSREAAVLPIVLTPDGSSYAYTYGGYASDLYLVTGLRQR
jgi:serine/threonine protein kinase